MSSYPDLTLKNYEKYMTVSRWKRVKQEMTVNSIGANGDEE